MFCYNFWLLCFATGNATLSFIISVCATALIRNSKFHFSWESKMLLNEKVGKKKQIAEDLLLRVLSMCVESNKKKKSCESSFFVLLLFVVLWRWDKYLETMKENDTKWNEWISARVINWPRSIDRMMISKSLRSKSMSRNRWWNVNFF